MYGVAPYEDQPYAVPGVAATNSPVLLPVRRYLNESTLATEYNDVATAGGTVTFVTTQAHEGTHSLRVNKTSAAANIYGGDTGAFPDGGSVHAGYFWLWVTTLPSGSGYTPIFIIYHSPGDNFEVVLSNTGAVRCRRQSTSLAGGTQSSSSATSITTGSWFKITWTHDSSGATLLGSVAVDSDTPVTVSWAQTAEVPQRMRFGTQSGFSPASNYDIMVDEEIFYAGTSAPTAPVLVAFPSTGILDNFNRADAFLSASGNWTNDVEGTSANVLSVISNQGGRVAAGFDNNAYWSANNFGADNEAYVTLSTAQPDIVLMARVNNPGSSTIYTSYTVRTRGSAGGGWNDLHLTATSNSGSTSISGYVGKPLNVGDRIGIRVVDTTIQGWYYDGTSGVWIIVFEVTNTTYASGGYIAIQTFDTPIRFDDFGGGTYTPIAVFVRNRPMIRRQSVNRAGTY